MVRQPDRDQHRVVAGDDALVFGERCGRLCDDRVRAIARDDAAVGIDQRAAQGDDVPRLRVEQADRADVTLQAVLAQCHHLFRRVDTSKQRSGGAIDADIGGLSTYPDRGSAPYQDATLVPASDKTPVVDSWQSEPDENLPVKYAPEGSSGSALSVGVMSGMDKIGNWTVAPTHVSIGFWGGTTIDLREAVFTSPETTITCIAVMGGVEVIVPPEMEVRVGGIGFMGGFGWNKLDQARPRRQAPAGNPVVTINGLGFWGGVGITRKERGEPTR